MSAQRVEDGAPGPTERVEGQDRLRRVLEVLGALPGRQRDVPRLELQPGLSYAKIGRPTRQETGTVGRLIQGGIRERRARVEPEGLRGIEA